MEITVTGRHFNLADADKQKAVDLINGYFADLPLKIISATVVLDKQANQFTADVVVNAKNDLTAKASVQDFELGKALASAVEKANIQITKHIEKRKNHKNGETLVQLEAKKAAEAE